MEIGIGLPNAVRGVEREGIVDWARRAEEAGFSSLGTIDRIVYPNFESLVTLAAAAAVTERIRLVTDILLAPLRTNTPLLAKQATTVDRLSRGRLVLGLAVGARPDDFEVSGVEYERRGAIFDRQLEELERLWGADSEGPSASMGPPPVTRGGPRLLIGGGADVAFRRAARYGIGWTMGGGGPDAFAEGVDKARGAWRAAGRDGQPYTMALFYFALGGDASEKARRGVGDYYAFLGEYRDRVVESTATSDDMVKQYLRAFEEAGANEVICFPSSTDLDDVGRLADAAL
jgi:alkanesulfonate monooxygenase SsuD/methylene tetrahydromethanopterin reductase-like flavin-dependent oxidoreductase (luciferase family)